MANILVVDDEVMINDMIKRNLTLVGHEITQAYDGKEALEKLKNESFDLILLDVMLPYLSGFELIDQCKDTPTIFLTAKDNMDDKIRGLTSGAEDYIVKPFEMLELIARINIVLRRNEHQENEIQIDAVTIDLGSKTVKRDGAIIELTPQEFRVLEVLIENKNLALSREQLLEKAWDFDYMGDTKTVDVHIQKLRKKLSFEERIKTVYKIGYRLEV
ncbi:phosphate regulon transcriptional regulatory protein PhoB [Lachnospiraceae bacterium KM106-2]|nr:phosphate regulon transcriptional regulatory protein PhoB [Lachnospiraceae bacterium KM106-2]